MPKASKSVLSITKNLSNYLLILCSDRAQPRWAHALLTRCDLAPGARARVSRPSCLAPVRMRRVQTRRQVGHLRTDTLASRCSSRPRSALADAAHSPSATRSPHEAAPPRTRDTRLAPRPSAATVAHALLTRPRRSGALAREARPWGPLSAQRALRRPRTSGAHLRSACADQGVLLGKLARVAHSRMKLPHESCLFLKRAEPGGALPAEAHSLRPCLGGSLSPLLAPFLLRPDAALDGAVKQRRLQVGRLRTDGLASGRAPQAAKLTAPRSSRTKRSPLPSRSRAASHS